MTSRSVLSHRPTLKLGKQNVSRFDYRIVTKSVFFLPSEWLFILIFSQFRSYSSQFLRQEQLSILANLHNAQV